MKREINMSAGLLQRAFNNSLLANVISKADNDRIIRANRAACKLLGYSNRQLSLMKMADIFTGSESGYKKMIKERNEKGRVMGDLLVMGKNGRLLPCEITSVSFNDIDGVRYLISTFVDRRERITAQKKMEIEEKRAARLRSDSLLTENNDWIVSISKSSYDVIWDWDILTDLISFGKNYEKIFGYKLPGNKISFANWADLIAPKERRDLKSRLRKIFKSKKSVWNYTYEFLRPDGSVAHVITRGNIIRNDQGKAIRMIGVVQDIGKLHKLEGALLQEMRKNEKQMVEAVAVAKEMERSDIGKELHDNVNQLLGASMLYLDMARTDIKNGEVYLMRSADYTITAIDAIRRLSRRFVTDTINDLGLSDAIEAIVRDTMESNPAKIRYSGIGQSLEGLLDNKFKLNIFRIIQEQMTNIIKHAEASEIDISIVEKPSQFTLTISDNGVGFDCGKKTAGIGMANIVSRAKIYKGSVSFVSKPGQGCKLLVTFPVADANNGIGQIKAKLP